MPILKKGLAVDMNFFFLSWRMKLTHYCSLETTDDIWTIS